MSLPFVSDTHSPAPDDDAQRGDSVLFTSSAVPQMPPMFVANAHDNALRPRHALADPFSLPVPIITSP